MIIILWISKHIKNTKGISKEFEMLPQFHALISQTKVYSQIKPAINQKRDASIRLHQQLFHALYFGGGPEGLTSPSLGKLNLTLDSLLGLVSDFDRPLPAPISGLWLCSQCAGHPVGGNPCASFCDEEGLSSVHPYLISGGYCCWF